MKKFYYIFMSLLCLNAFAQNHLDNFNLKGNITSFSEVIYSGTYDSKAQEYIKKDTIQFVTNHFNKKGLLTYSINKRFKDSEVDFMINLTYHYKNDTLEKVVSNTKLVDLKDDEVQESIGNVSHPEPNKLIVDIVDEKEDMFHYQNEMIFKNNKLQSLTMRDLRYGRKVLFSEFYEYDKNGDILKATEKSMNSVTTTKHLKYDKHKNSVYAVSSNPSKPNEFEIRERLIQYND